MITESVVGRVVTAKFSLFEWKVLNVVLASIKPASQSDAGMALVNEVTERMDDAGFSIQDYPWIASTLSMEIDTREIASLVIGPVKVQAMQDTADIAEAEVAIKNGCALQ